MYKKVITTCTEMKYINNNECNDNGIVYLPTLTP